MHAYTQEIEKCEKLTSELSTCHDIISNLRSENAKLIAKVEKLDSCDDSTVSLRNDNTNLIAKIEHLNASLSSLKIENEKLIAKAKDLNVCNVSISDLRDENAILHAKIVELNTCKPSTSAVEHVTICTRCRDINVDAIHDHLALIKQQNDHIVQLSAKINEHELENEKFKFARSMLYSGRLWGTDIPRVHQKDKRPHERPVGPIVREVIPSWAWEERPIRRINTRLDRRRPRRPDGFEQ
jgi:chromosome segregation ATPase